MFWPQENEAGMRLTLTNMVYRDTIICAVLDLKTENEVAINHGCERIEIENNK